MFGRDPGGFPPSYWFPALGNAFSGPGLRPGDVTDLTPLQLLSAAQAIPTD